MKVYHKNLAELGSMFYAYNCTGQLKDDDFKVYPVNLYGSDYGSFIISDFF